MNTSLSDQSRRARNFVISGTNYWNPGDDFVRDGVIHVLRQTFPGDHLNFHFYNFGEDQFPKSKFRGIGNEVSPGDLDLYRDFIDGVIIAGLSAGHEIKDLYNWVLANGLEDRVYLIGAGYENSYCAEHVLAQPEAAIFRQARIIIGRTAKRPGFIAQAGAPYVHLNCPALLSVPEVKLVEPGRKIRRIGFSIQLPHDMGIVNQTCDPGVHRLACRIMLNLAKTHEVELVAHHKSEYFLFLHLLRDTGVPVLYSSFYQDLHDVYQRYDAVVTTRLHSSLYANGHGIPGIIINDTDRHTHTLDGFPHSVWVNTQEAFDREFARLLLLDLRRVADEMRAFKEQLAQQYVQVLKPAFTGAAPASSEAPNKELTAAVAKAVGDVDLKQSVLDVMSRLTADHWLENNKEDYRKSIAAGAGWFDTPTFLNWFARNFAPQNYLEIGVRRGRSMSQVLSQSPATNAYGFDLWIADYGSIPEKGILTTNPGPEFVSSELRRLGVTKEPTFIAGSSHDTLRPFLANPLNPQQFDLMLVDGDHSDAGARRDLEVAFAHVAPGGAIVFDDTRNSAHPGLQSVWDEFKNLRPEFLFIEDAHRTGTAVAFRPPFQRLAKAVGIESGPAENADTYRFDSERKEQLLVRSLVKPGMTVLDVGAHVGKYTKLFSLIVGQEGRVFSFEPTPSSARKLAGRIEDDHLGNVTLIRKAVCDHDGIVTLHQFPEEYSSWNGLGRPLMEDPRDGSRLVPIIGETEVAATTLDEFCQSQGLARIDYLKLDVEGAEIHALRGATGLLGRQAVSCLQFEVSRKMLDGLGARAREVFEFLSNHGYECHAIGEDGRVGPVATDSDAFYDNYIAFPVKAAALINPAKDLPVNFFTIVLNGQPFIRHHIETLRQLPFQWHWHIIEGVAELKHDTAWSVAAGGRIPDSFHKDGLSVDGTTGYLDELKRAFPDRITIHRPPAGKFWDGKREMVNAPLASIQDGCLLWQLDADEIWTVTQVIRCRALFLAHPEKTAAMFYCHYFVGPDRVITSRDTYGNHSSFEWLRVWRFQPGDRWIAHEPPRLGRAINGAQLVDVGGINPFRHADTEAMGLVFQHYAYATEAQVRFKQDYYGYPGAAAQWRKLQEAEKFPCKLADYFAWVKDEAAVDTLASQNIQPLVALEDVEVVALSNCDAPRRILFIRTDSIGDAVLASSMIGPIRRRYPDAQLAVLCQQHVAELFSASPFIQTVICYERAVVETEPGRQEIINDIAQFNPDLVLNSVRSRDALSETLTHAFPGAFRVGIESDLNNIDPVARDQAAHQYDRIIPGAGGSKPEMAHHAAFLRGLGISADHLQPVIWTSEDDEHLAEAFFRQHGLDPLRTMAVFPFTQHAIKNYPAFAPALAKFVGWSFLVFGGAESEPGCEELTRALPGPAFNLAGRTSLREMAALIRRCRIMVGSDSCGPHIACAAGVPNVVVLGGGHPGRFFPYSPLTSVAVLPLPCSGCSWACKFPAPHCVTDITPAFLADVIRRSIESTATCARVFPHPSDRASLIEGGPAKHFAETKAEIIQVSESTGAATEPLVSVLVSTYAAEKYLRACLDDLEAQTIADKIEIIVIDSGSPENERGIVEDFQRRHTNIRYIRTEREPLYVAWNRGVKLSRGRFVVNANTDDSRRPDAFQILLEAMETHQDADLAYAHYGMSGRANDQFPPKSVFRNVRHDPYHPAQLLFYCITGCLQFWRKSALERIGGFDESLKCVADYEILLRFMRRGLKPLLVPEILSTFFINQKGLSFGSDTAFKEDQKVMERYRSIVRPEEIYAVDSSNPREMARAWINLGNLASATQIPWDDQPRSSPEYAVSCYQKAVALDADCQAAWHNLAALSIRLGITEYFSKTFRGATVDIDGILARAKLNPDVIGFDLPPKIQGYYFQRPGAPVETAPVTRMEPDRTANESVPSGVLAVSWEGSFLDLGSLSHINRELTDRLSRQKDFTISTVGVNAIPPSMRHDRDWKRRARKLHAEPSGRAAVTVRHQWPPDWSRPARGSLVVIQPWEFGALPQEWVKAAAQVDEFWASSNYVKSVYVSSGVDASKVRVIPNGVDTRRYCPEAKPMRLETRKRFKFLFVGGTIGRKGPDVLLRAYLQTFTAADDVCLVIKDFGANGVYRGLTMDGLIEQARRQPNSPEILHLKQELSPVEMPGLFTACDCLVHPYRGEGFGLPILEAMSCGRPVIVTRGGAADDFVSESAGWFIDSQRRSIGTAVSNIPLVADGWLLEPDVNHLATLLQRVAAHPIEARAKGEAGARLAREKYDWATVTSMVADRLKIVARRSLEKPAESSGEQPVANAVVKRTVPSCALLGQVDRAKGFLARKNLAEAWKAACVAVEERPFNPPAWHLLGEIALAARDFALARTCLETLRPVAPTWEPTKNLAGQLAGKKDGLSSGFKLPAAAARPRLSVCLIVKNEEKFLAPCLKSVEGLADQIIVVDTGSQDRTMEIAREHGAEVHAFEWCDDFSAARNAALEHATGDWILVLDADEELSPAGRDVLPPELRDDLVMAYRLPIIEAGRAGEGCHYVPRLFRNAPGIYFSGRIHEHAFGAVEVLRQEWGLDNRLGRAELIHHGYTAAVTLGRDKVARNRKLLEQALAESPDDANLLMNLGLELVRSNELSAGLDRYLTALRLLSRMPSGSVVPELRESLLTQLTTHLLSAGRFNEIVTTLQSPLATQSGLTASLHFVLGLALLELKQHQSGADHFNQCLSKRNERGLTPINPEIRRAGPNHCLAMCLIALKQPVAAEQALRAALVDEPGAMAVRFDLARVWAARGRAVDALTLLHEMISENANDARTWLLGGEIALSQPELLEFATDWTGEAVKHFPRERAMAWQRAEALLLSGKIEQARPLFRLHRDAGNLRALAALALIELIADAAEPCFSLVDQAAVGREFVQWYRRLLAFGAGPVIEQINVRLPQLRGILPSAATALEAALADAVA